ncbi:FAD-dependent monooxygenase [Micromonospora sp. NPDC050417]|uniref:FAD-dependent monooxygenase n=1 Tax=Micromonospora sp. NPDC050417 TaxID=3364280 RepID=UPI00378F1AA5
MRGRGIRVLVVGAGIAGLATVRALRDWGATIDLVERSAGLTTTGTGLYLPGNAARALRTLGLFKPVAEAAVEIERQRTANSRGRRLFEVDVAQLWRGVGPCLSLHRAELHRVLLAGIEEQPVRWGRHPVTLVAEGEQVAVEFDDGSTERYDLVIGADGVNSTVRRLAFDGAQPRSLDQYAYRFLAPRIDSEPVWSVRFGPGTQFLTIPISADQVYCYYNAGKGGDRPGWRDEIRVGFGEPAATLLGALDDAGADAVYAGPNREVVLDSWTRGAVLLIGDAAHATSPNMAQGAAMALEDALVLAESLRTAGTVGEALRGYELRRRPRTDWVLGQTHRRDHALGLAPVLRDTVMAGVGRRMFRANYAPLFRQP